MASWFHRLRKALRRGVAEIPQAVWHDTLRTYPFLLRHGAHSGDALRSMAQQFLAHKEFHGAAGLVVDDAMAVAIAAQACLPVLGIRSPYQGTAWYQDFVGIVVYPGAVRAQRESVDADGVVHHYQEVLSGEAMQDGPVTLSWEDVAAAGATAAEGYNVVVHEFVHKIDMRSGQADGCPPLPVDFMGCSSNAAARRLWLGGLRTAHDDFCDRLSLAERFGGAPVWLDAYAAQSPGEFFAVASEAYFVNPARFAQEFPALLPLFDAFFQASMPAG